MPNLLYNGRFIGGRMTISTFVGRAPGFVGLDQVNLIVPSDSPEGCSIPLRFGAAHSSSPELPISIKAGGGTCSPAALPRLGEVRLERSIVSGVAVPPPEYAVAARFIENRFIREESPPSAAAVYCIGQQGQVPSSAGACPEFRDRWLELGNLALEIPPEPVQRVQPPYMGTSQAVPPASAGALLTLRSSGGIDVGPLTAAIRMPASLELETTFAPFSVISSKRDLFVRWKGGEPGSRVRVRLVSRRYEGDLYLECGAPVERGFLRFPVAGEIIGLPLSSEDYPAMIEVDMEPSPEQMTRFSAPGLPEGTFTWRYRWIFDRLKLD